MEYDIFYLSDLTDDLLKRVVFYHLSHSSGLGGPGMLCILTDDGQEYRIGFEGLLENERQFLERFPLVRDCLSSKSSDDFFQVGEWFYRRLPLAQHVFARADFARDFIPSLDENQNNPYVDALKIAKKLLDPEKRLRLKLHAETAEIWRKREEEDRIIKEHREAVRLRPEDIVWHECATNSTRPLGCYTLLLKKIDNQIIGKKWTIFYQREQYCEYEENENAPVEAYNLFIQEYSNMGGRLEYPEELNTVYRYSTLDDGFFGIGSFVRSYKTLDAAKNAVWESTGGIFDCTGGIDRTNLLRMNYEAMTEEEIKADYYRAVGRQLELQRKFPEICAELVQILSTYDYPGNAIPEISERLNITQEDVTLIWDFFEPYPFCKVGMSGEKPWFHAK